MNTGRFALALLLGVILGSVGTMLWLRLGTREISSPEAGSSGASVGVLSMSPSGAKASDSQGSSPEPSPRSTIDWEEVVSKSVENDIRMQAYLDQRGRSKEALTAAGLLTGDKDLLREAAERFPDDPQVQFLAISHELFPEKQREWIERFRASQPENALAAYYMAGEHFRSGDVETAIAELQRGVGLDQFDDFSDEGMLGSEALALDFGLSPMEAKVRGMFGAPLPYLTQFVEITKQLEKAQGERGSPEEATEWAALGVAMGNDFSQGTASRFLINQLIGLSIETRFLNKLDPSLESPYFSGTPGALLAEIEGDRDRIREVAQTDFMSQVASLGEPMAMHYLERVRMTGEAEAIEWLRRRISNR